MGLINLPTGVFFGAGGLPPISLVIGSWLLVIGSWLVARSFNGRSTVVTSMEALRLLALALADAFPALEAVLSFF